MLEIFFPVFFSKNGGLPTLGSSPRELGTCALRGGNSSGWDGRLEKRGLGWWGGVSFHTHWKKGGFKTIPPPKMNECPLKRDHFKRKLNLPTIFLSGDMLVFRGVLISLDFFFVWQTVGIKLSCQNITGANWDFTRQKFALLQQCYTLYPCRTMASQITSDTPDTN